MTENSIKILKVAYHRNGVFGEGFYVVTFSYGNQRMVGVLFGQDNFCAILDIDLLSDNNIEFAKGNSWRGDFFEGRLRDAIFSYETEREEGNV